MSRTSVLSDAQWTRISDLLPSWDGSCVLALVAALLAGPLVTVGSDRLGLLTIGVYSHLWPTAEARTRAAAADPWLRCSAVLRTPCGLGTAASL